MHRDYRDILDQLGAPQWWDDRAVPRYVTFHPLRCGFYDCMVALMVITCASCGKLFQVSIEIDRRAPRPPLPTSDNLYVEWSYGHPPNHGCDGDNIVSNPVQITEFWMRQPFVWTRHPEYEAVAYAEP